MADPVGLLLLGAVIQGLPRPEFVCRSPTAYRRQYRRLNWCFWGRFPVKVGRMADPVGLLLLVAVIQDAKAAVVEDARAAVAGYEPPERERDSRLRALRATRPQAGGCRGGLRSRAGGDRIVLSGDARRL